MDKILCPVIYIVAVADTYDITAVDADITTMETTLQADSGVIHIDSANGDYDLWSEGFQVETVNGKLDNLLNPRKTHKVTFMIPSPEDTTKKDALIALSAKGAVMKNVYGCDPYTASSGYVMEMLYAKVNVDETATPEGVMYTITCETKNDGNFKSDYLVQDYTP